MADRQPSEGAPSPRRDKGKGRELPVEYSQQPKSLLRRLAGPSDQKAGLSRDPEEVKRIIYQASQNSAYFKNEERKDAELTKKIEGFMASLNAKLAERGGDVSREEALADEMIGQLEQQRALNEVIMVCDADAFYASCHQRRDPSLAGKAFAVGGGVLTTASYEARKYGCRSAMAGFVAKKLCPHLILINPEFSLYTAASKEIFGILAQYGTISPASLDEAYVSLTEYCRREGVSPEEAARRVREQIKTETRLTVSAGVSPNALISKIAADINKPDGQLVVEPNSKAMIDFMSDLPIRKVPGIGRVTERWLQSLGVLKVGDIYKKRGTLYLIREKIGLTFLLRAYLGLGSNVVQPGKRGDRKGIGVEETFRATSDPQAQFAQLREIADSLGKDMERSEYSARTIHLKVKRDNYVNITRSCTKNFFTKDADTLFNEAKRLLTILQQVDKASGKTLTVRLLGIRCSNLRDDRASAKGGTLDSWAGAEKQEHHGTLPLDEDDEDDEENDDGGDDGSTAVVPTASSRRSESKSPERYKPFFTAGESLNSRLPLGGVPRSDQLNFSTTASTSESPDEFSVRDIDCPVCGVTFRCSATGMAAHVAKHFDAPDAGEGSASTQTRSGPPPKKKKKTSSSSSSTTEKAKSKSSAASLFFKR